MKNEHKDLGQLFYIDGEAETILGVLKGFVSKHLISDVRESLLGYKQPVQVLITEYLLDFAQGGCIRYTGIKRLDALMKRHYYAIAYEIGIFKKTTAECTDE